MKRKYLISVLIICGAYIASGLEVKVTKSTNSSLIGFISYLGFSISSIWLGIIYLKNKGPNSILAVLIGLILIIIGIISILAAMFVPLAKPW